MVHLHLHSHCNDHSFLRWLCRVSNKFTFLCFHSYISLLALSHPYLFPFLFSLFLHTYLVPFLTLHTLPCSLYTLPYPTYLHVLFLTLLHTLPISPTPILLPFHLHPSLTPPSLLQPLPVPLLLLPIPNSSHTPFLFHLPFSQPQPQYFTTSALCYSNWAGCTSVLSLEMYIIWYEKGTPWQHWHVMWVYQSCRAIGWSIIYKGGVILLQKNKLW